MKLQISFDHEIEGVWQWSKKNPHFVAGNYHRLFLGPRLSDYLLFIGNDLGTIGHWDGVSFDSITLTTQIYSVLKRFDLIIAEECKIIGSCSEIQDGFMS